MNTVTKKPEMVNDHDPHHVAIIMDGNRRYAAKKGISVKEGHVAGAENLLKITEAALEKGIKVLTVYAFSTENWMRSLSEVQTLFEIFEMYLLKMKPMMIKQRIKFSVIGDKEPLPENLQELIYEVSETTKDNQALELVLAINYGGRADLTRAMKHISKDVKEGKISLDDISEQLIDKYLYTSKWPDPNLLIRTSGEHRISNFLLWQISYSEIYLENTLWPEFTKKQFYNTIECYKKRTIRLGV